MLMATAVVSDVIAFGFHTIIAVAKGSSRRAAQKKEEAGKTEPGTPAEKELEAKKPDMKKTEDKT